MIAARAEATSNGGDSRLLGLIPAEARRWLARGRGRVVYVTAKAETPGGGVFLREAVIELRPGADPPFVTHGWRPALAVGTPKGAG
ncbi:MAG: hypothetical protein JSU82_04770 [Rhodospirillales bacterium]|nr:MAG: hypothetical protein JSU82_04770 [Rhodospirillales bacterium]